MSKKSLAKTKNNFENSSENTSESVSISNSKKKILRAALKLFAEKGFDGVSIRDISRSSGQNISQVSYYFKNKEGLYKTILKDHAVQMIEKITKVIKNLSQEKLNKELFEKEMLYFISIFVNMRNESPYLFKIMLRETSEGMPHVREIHKELVKPLMLHMDEVMRQAKKQKLIKKGAQVRLFFMLLTEAIHGFMAKKECQIDFLEETVDVNQDPEEFAKRVYDIFFKGILA